MKRILYLDIIRIFACICILIIHFNAAVCGWELFGRFEYQNQLIPNFYFGTYLGEIGVGLFFIISGAGLYCGYDFNKLSKSNIINFYKKRAQALYPMYWIAFCLASVIHFLYYKSFSMANKFSIISSILGIDGYLGMMVQKYCGFYQVGEWFLGCIIIIYLLWPFLAYLLNKIPIILWGGIGVIYFLYIDKFSYNLFLFQLPYLMFGYCFMKYIKTAKNIKVWIGVLLLLLSRFLFNDSLHYFAKAIILDLFLFLLLALLVESFCNNLNENKIKVIALMSTVTYPMFLIHHKFINIITDMYDLQHFPYRYTLILFFIYIISVYLMSIKLKKCTDYVIKVWLCKGVN